MSFYSIPWTIEIAVQRWKGESFTQNFPFSMKSNNMLGATIQILKKYGIIE